MIEKIEINRDDKNVRTIRNRKDSIVSTPDRIINIKRRIQEKRNKNKEIWIFPFINIDQSLKIIIKQEFEKYNILISSQNGSEWWYLR